MSSPDGPFQKQVAKNGGEERRWQPGLGMEEEGSRFLRTRHRSLSAGGGGGSPGVEGGPGSRHVQVWHGLRVKASTMLTSGSAF